MDIRVTRTKLDGVMIIETNFARDERGFFLESYHRRNYVAHGISGRFVQDNHSRSSINVLRGLHYQDMTAPQAKMVRCVVGAIWDVAVDLRVGSPSFGQWIGVDLTAENMCQLYVPIGFAHGFVARSESAEILYKCTDYYTPSAEGSIAWDDPDLGIDWPVNEPILSQRDRSAMSLRNYLIHPAFRYTPKIQPAEQIAARMA